jgi:diaminopimelate decarboxylase
MIWNNLSVNEKGHLTFAGRDTVELAQKYGTPLYLMDEDRIRERCRTYREALREAFGEGANALYAGKAACFKDIYRVMREEGMGIDVVSSGEIYTAHAAGFPMERAYFHGSNKTDADIAYAMDCGVGYFVADNREELDAADAEAERRGIRQKVLLRLTPGIDPHTYEAISTGKVDSKFGSAIETGQADEIVAYALTKKQIDLVGFHCHVGSQVFDSDVYLRASAIMLQFIADMRAKYGYTARQLDLGGGYGVRYLESDPEIDIAENIREVGAAVRAQCEALGIALPDIRMEPGRSIVADAGLTLYTVGAVKRIPGYKNYVSVDGGMTDNPRFALYRAPYTVASASRMNEPVGMRASLVGRCCESGDIIQEDVGFPETVTRGDLVAVMTTGAYNFAMSSNYNRIPRPPVVMLCGGEDKLAVKRESFADLCKNDL